jgi:hypothetical protein
VWSVPRGYKGTKQVVWVNCCREFGRVLEMAFEGNGEEMAWNELDCTKKTSYVIWSESETYKSVARIRLVKTENLSVCATVNCKVCRSAIALLIPVVPSCVNKVSKNPIVQSKNPSISHAQNLYTWQYYIHVDFTYKFRWDLVIFNYYRV